VLKRHGAADAPSAADLTPRTLSRPAAHQPQQPLAARTSFSHACTHPTCRAWSSRLFGSQSFGLIHRDEIPAAAFNVLKSGAYASSRSVSELRSSVIVETSYIDRSTLCGWVCAQVARLLTEVTGPLDDNPVAPIASCHVISISSMSVSKLAKTIRLQSPKRDAARTPWQYHQSASEHAQKRDYEVKSKNSPNT
jgi:hypothetical protein